MRARILVPVTVVLVIAVGVVASGAFGRPATKMPTYSAQLNVAQEVPAPKGAPSNAGGTFSATLNGKTLTWKLTFHNLSGTATAAHIHMGKKGKPGAVIVPLCGAPKCVSPVSGKATVTSAEIKAMNSAGTYVNVHTAKNPNGEIRGQVM
jgi:hypothetical protein